MLPPLAIAATAPDRGRVKEVDRASSAHLAVSRELAVRISGWPERAKVATMPDGPPPTYEQIIADLAAGLAGDPSAAGDLGARAEELAKASGIRVLAETLAIAERILRAGEAFHSIERFFVDGSEEQRYLIELHRRG